MWQDNLLRQCKMLKLQSLVVNVGGQDISAMVLNLTVFESIKGYIKGSFIVQDNINFYDTFIGITQAPIQIQFEYLNILCTNVFYGNGISNMKIEKLGKIYTVHFISYTAMNDQLTMINNVYSGTSDNIIDKLFTESNNGNATLVIDSAADTKGRYVVPNIKAASALKHVVAKAYDTNNSGLCLYQRLYDQGVTRLTSLLDMAENYFFGDDEKIFNLTQRLAGASEDSDGLDSNDMVGTSASFELNEYYMNFTEKLADGNWGNKIQQVHLDETATKKFEVNERTDVSVTVYKTSIDLYDDGVKSLFSLGVDPDSFAAKNQKKRVFGQYMNVLNVVAVPGLSAGFTVGLNQGGSNISSTKTDDNNYIIANINHRFMMNDGKFEYAQDIGLIRE
jgi:hypothetical protein